MTKYCYNVQMTDIAKTGKRGGFNFECECPTIEELWAQFEKHGAVLVDVLMVRPTGEPGVLEVMGRSPRIIGTALIYQLQPCTLQFVGYDA